MHMEQTKFKLIKDRIFMVSPAIQNRVTSDEQRKILNNFIEIFELRNKRFIEFRFSEFEYIYCHVPRQIFYVCFEEEW